MSIFGIPDNAPNLPPGESEMVSKAQPMSEQNEGRVSDERLEGIRVQLIKGRQAISFDENLMMVWELQASRASTRGEPGTGPVPREQWGSELWEILFGVMKGAVPDEMTNEVLQQTAESFYNALTASPAEAVVTDDE